MYKKYKFRYAYSVIVLLLLILLFLLSGLGIFLNIKSLVKTDMVNSGKFTTDLLSLILNLFLLSCSVLAIICPRYTVKNKTVYASIGFLRFFKIELKEISSIKDINERQFAIILKDGAHVILSTTKNEKDGFIKAVINSSENTIILQQEKN